MDFSNTGLVLEGGGMRGTFTSGVLDAFMKHGVHFPYIVAVSAGACNGLSYVSNQLGRAHFSNITMLEKYHYVGIKHLVKTGCIFDPDLLYDELPNKIYPYDYEAYFKSGVVYEQVVTNCLTGRAEYLYEKDGNDQRLLDITHASSSLPFVSKIINVDGTPYLDGGIVDSIPVERAMEQGYEKCVVVLTRNKGYRKPGKDVKLPRFFYRRYPRLRVALSRRLKEYNQRIDLVEKLEAEGKVEVIRPVEPIVVDRLEKNPKKLEDLYQQGLKLGEEFCQRLKKQ